MILDEILEYSNEDGVKESKHKHPTLKQVQKQLQGFDESLVLFVYHKMNGREDEANSYLAEWEDEQKELNESFKVKNDLEKINSMSITETNVSNTGEYNSSDAVSDAEK